LPRKIVGPSRQCRKYFATENQTSTRTATRHINRQMYTANTRWTTNHSATSISTRRETATNQC